MMFMRNGWAAAAAAVTVSATARPGAQAGGRLLATSSRVVPAAPTAAHGAAAARASGGRTAGLLASSRMLAAHLVHGVGVSPSVLRGAGFHTTTTVLGSAGTDFTVTCNRQVRNVAVIAHVDHGKTTLVDGLLRQAGEAVSSERAMDWNALEQERGITILSKCTSVRWAPPGATADADKWHLNIVDTPGHADFGGEVERILSMVDGVMLVVDASEGPMPQTKFVLGKALAKRLRPVVVINKVDRPDSRIHEVEDEILSLFLALDAHDECLDYPTLYGSAREGWMSTDMDAPRNGLQPLFQALVDHIPAPKLYGGPDDELRMLVTQMENNSFVGRLGLGKIASGRVKIGDPLKLMTLTGQEKETGRVTKIFVRRGLTPSSLDSAEAGDIVQIAGLANARPTDTIMSPNVSEPLDSDPIDPPTISMAFGVNDSPLAGKSGKNLTGTHISDRLNKEAETNVAISLAPCPSELGMPDATEVRGRGELQLSVLIETMRREGFELSVSPPRVLVREENGQKLEPWEEVTIDVDDQYAGTLIEKLSLRKGELIEYNQHAGKSRLLFRAPSRALIGFQNEFRTDTKGTGLMNRAFWKYDEYQAKLSNVRKGALVSSAAGPATAYAIAALEPRGSMFIKPGTAVYEGMVIGEHTREGDLDVNPVKTKKLTNIRAAGSDEFIRLTPPIEMTLEEAITYVRQDELVEVTPEAIRLRKQVLSTTQRDIMARNRRKQD